MAFTAPTTDIMDPQEGFRAPASDVIEGQNYFDVPAIDIDKLPPPSKTDIKGVLGSVTRGAGPYGVAAIGGAAVGTPFAGVGSLPGALAGVGAMGLSKFVGDPAVAAANRYLGTDFTQPTEALNNLMTRMGIEEPDTPTEQMVSMFAEGGASGPVQAGRSIGRQALSGIVSTGLAEQARSGVERMGAGAKLQFVAALAVGGGTGIATAPRGYAVDSPMVRYDRFGGQPSLSEMSVLASRASKGDDFAKRQLASIAATGVDPGTFKAAQEMGIEAYLTPGQLTTNKVFREFEETLASMPDSAASRVREGGLQEMSAFAHNLVNRIFSGENAGDVSSTVNKVQTYMDRLTTRLKRMGDDQYGKLNQLIDPKLRNPATRIVTHLEDKMSKLSGTDNPPRPIVTKQGVKWPMPEGFESLSPVEKNAYRELRPVPRLDKAGRVYYEHPTYYKIDNVRKQIGRAQDNKLAFPDEDQFELGTLYDALTEDQGAYVRKAGVDIAEWELAKGYVKQRKAVEDSMSLLFGKQLDKSFQQMITTATKNLAKGDAESFERVMSQVPKSMRRDVTLSGIMSVINKNAASGDFDLQGFAKWYNALDGQSASRNAIMQYIPQEARVGLKNIAKVGETITETGRTSPGYVAAAVEKSNSLMNQLYYTAAKATGVVLLQNTIADVINSRAASYSLAYNTTSAVQSAAKNKALIATNRFIGSPEFGNLVRAMARGDDLPKYVARLSKTQAAITYARAAGIPARQKDIEEFLISGLTFMEFDRKQEAPPNASGEAPAR